jgi:hypothetical protein
MFLIDSRGKRPVCLACHRIGPYQQAAPGVTARCVYGVLARYAYQGTTVRIGQRRVAKLLGLHVETVNVALHQLESCDHIAIRGSGKDRSTYHLQSRVFGQKQRAGIEEVISSPSRTRRLATTRRA